jgi:hypothetical protein
MLKMKTQTRMKTSEWTDFGHVGGTREDEAEGAETETEILVDSESDAVTDTLPDIERDEDEEDEDVDLWISGVLLFISFISFFITFTCRHHSDWPNWCP